MDNELYHYGMPKRSGRYPYGSGDRPYQSSEGTSSKSKKKGFLQSLKNKKKEKKIEKIILTEQEMQKEKKRVVKEGTALEVKQWKSLMTTKEFEEAVKRIELSAKVDAYSRSELEQSWDKLDRAMYKLKTATGWVNTSLNAYQTFNNVMSVINGASSYQQGGGYNNYRRR